VRTDGADRVEDPWDQLTAVSAPGTEPGGDEDWEAALLAYKQRKAAAWGAERFAAEMRRRDEAEEARPVWTGPLAEPVDAEVEGQVVDGEPVAFLPEPRRIGFDPMFIPELAEPPAAARIADPGPPLADDPVVEPEPAEAADVSPVEEPDVEPPEFEDDEVELPVVELPVVEPPAIEVRRFEPDAPWSAGATAASSRLPAALRHPHVPRPPAPIAEPQPLPRRGWRGRRAQPEPVRPSVVSAPEWARMSPGARRLYGLDDHPPAERRAG
jgi:hypothetical protein